MNWEGSQATEGRQVALEVVFASDLGNTSLHDLSQENEMQLVIHAMQHMLH